MNASALPPDSPEALLREYRSTGAEAVLRRLIACWLPLVYSTARRRTGSEALAADVTQAVFCDFARQARALPDGFHAGGWLLRHTGFLASRALRTERRRAAREAEAARRRQLDSSATMNAPLHSDLDAAMQRLSAADQSVLVLRFYEEQETPVIAARLGISSAAAQKRLERALERLRRLMPGQPAAPVIITGLTLLLARKSSVAALPAGALREITGAAVAAAARPLPAWSVWLRHLSPAGGAIAGSAAALVLAAGPLVPWAAARSKNPRPPEPPASAAHAVALPPAKARPAPETPTAASVVEELRELVAREGYNRIAYQKAEAIVSKLPREHCGEALVLLAEQFPVRRYFANAGGPERWPHILLWRWQPEDPAAALGFLLPKLPARLRDEAVFNICQDWYRKDAAAATAWWRTLLEDTSGALLPGDCRKAVVRRLGYWVLEAMRKENLPLAAETAERMESQGIETLVSSQSSGELRAQMQRAAHPATPESSPEQAAEMKTVRRLLSAGGNDRIEQALQIKDEALRDYTLAAMAARDLDSATGFPRGVLKEGALPPELAAKLRTWLALPE